MSVYNPFASDGWRTRFGDASVSGSIVAATAGLAGIIAAKSAKYTIYVQSIAVTITTSAAQTITFRDTAGTNIILFVIPASAAVGTVYTVNFGAKGFALTEGKNLDIVGTAGPAYAYTVEAYQFPSSADQATTSNRTI